MRVKMRGETSEVTVAQNAYGYKYEDEYSIPVRIQNVDHGVLVSIQIGIIYHTYFNYLVKLCKHCGIVMHLPNESKWFPQ